MDALRKKVTYREFRDDDLDALIDIIAKQWFPYLDNKEAIICATGEVIEHIANSTRGLVGELDGKLMGVCFARWGECGRQDMWLECLQSLISVNKISFNIERELALLQDETSLMEEVSSNFGDEGVGALELLIVSPEARGYGIGGSLMKMSLDWLREQGATDYRLVTDDDCDWAFYEYKGLKRMGEREITFAGAQDETQPFNIYVYQGKLD